MLCTEVRLKGANWEHGDFISFLFLFLMLSPGLSVRLSVSYAGVSLRESLTLVPRVRSAVCTARKGRSENLAAL